MNGKSILEASNSNILSFHATKTYTTVESGALFCHNAKTKKRIDYLKNFGFARETKVTASCINFKMDEIRTASGLLNLKYVDVTIGVQRKGAQI